MSIRGQKHKADYGIQPNGCVWNVSSTRKPPNEILDLLLQLEAAAPPIVPHTHHCLMVTKYGSDEIGWTNKLTLQMNVNGNFQSFFIDDKDLEKPVEDVCC